jgi:hypothetical protein
MFLLSIGNSDGSLLPSSVGYLRILSHGGGKRRGVVVAGSSEVGTEVATEKSLKH